MKLFPTLRKAALLLLAAIMGSACADEASLKRAIETKFEAQLKRKVTVTSVNKTQYGGLYEVFSKESSSIFYTDEKFTFFLIDGQLIDTSNFQNITEARLNKLTAIKFSELPMDQAIVSKRGNGKRVMVTFEDPNCGYCRKLLRDLQGIDNLTVYTFLIPILSEDSLEKSRQIWCAPDRAKAWSDWMLQNRLPTTGNSCNTKALEKNQELAIRHNVSATPTIFFPDSGRVPGALPKAELERRLAQQGQ